MEDKKLYQVESLNHIDFRDHVTLRPKMYFKDCFTENNLNSIVIGALCHAIDEYFDENCSEISIFLSENSLKIIYNAGMSLEKSLDLTRAECIMTKIGACSSEKKHLEVGDEFCRVGMAVINAVSGKCKVITIYNNQKAQFIFENGYTVFKEIVETEIVEQSTTINFEINKEIFGDFVFELIDLQSKINSLKEKLPNLEIKLYK